MRVTFLGTGTSVGIPAIGCDCPVCRSDDPRNVRRRTSLFVEAGGRSILIDTTPEFREQALRHRVTRVDAVLFTHAHADHIFGFDDIRRFNALQRTVIPAYAAPETLANLRRVFNYVEGPPEKEVYRPQIDFIATNGPFNVGDCRVEPLPVEHGRTATQGYRIDAEGRSIGYVPDCHRMDDAVVESCRGVDVMVLDGLRYREHPTHLTVDGSVALLKRIGAGRSFLIHMCHDLDHAETEAELPNGIKLSYDGLVLKW